MLFRSDGTELNLLSANFCLQIGYLKKCHAVAARLQLVRERKERIYVTGDGWADDTKVSQLPEDRSGG